MRNAAKIGRGARHRALCTAYLILEINCDTVYNQKNTYAFAANVMERMVHNE